MAEDTLPGPGVLDVWVLQGEEEPLEPLLPIVDPHHHLWYARDTPEWRSTKAAQLSFGGSRSGFGQYLVPQLLADMHGNNITHTVFLECHSFCECSGSLYVFFPRLSCCTDAQTTPRRRRSCSRCARRRRCRSSRTTTTRAVARAR